MTSGAQIQTRFPRRRAALFLLALAAPCLVLAWLGIEVNRQESQLAARRAGEEREARLARFRADLLSGLERVKRQAAAGRESEAAVLVAAIRDGRLVLPSDGDSHAREFRSALGNSEFGARIRAAEREELGSQHYDEAAVHYRNALAVARLPWQRAYGTLLLARAERKAGRRPEARAGYRAVLQSPGELQDEYGIPFALYAVEPLLDFAADRAEAARALRRLAGAPHQRQAVRPAPLFPAPAIAMMRDLAAKLGAGDLLPEMNRLLREREQAEGLQSDFRHLLARLQGDQPVWIPYGDPLWLVGLSNSQGGTTVVAVVAGEALAAMGARAEGVRIVQGKEGELLGESFPGLRAIVPAPVARNGALRRLYFGLALAFVVGLTLVAGFLLWRDLRRSERLAGMRSHFISSVSHELRTPLTSIRMFTESMRMDDEMDADTRAQYLDTVLHESERLSRLVDNVLHFARIEQGRAVYDLRPTALTEVVGRAVRSFGPLAEQAGFLMEVCVEPGLPDVLADRDALEQAILNLLGNAMKYSGSSREIALRVEREDSCAAIRVIDRGIGIALDEQGRIFDRFYRGASARNSQIPGAGLGLTLVDHIAKAHGGSVSVESRPDSGSTFTLRIPFAPERAEARCAVPERI